MKPLLALFFLSVSTLPAAQAARVGVSLLTQSEHRIYIVEDYQSEAAFETGSFDLSDNPLATATPLPALSDRQSLAMGYPAAYYNCEGTPYQREHVQHLTDELDRSPEAFRRRFLPLVLLPLRGDLVVLAEKDGQNAILMDRANGQRLPGSACGAANLTVRVSKDMRRVALISETLKEGGYRSGPFQVNVYTHDGASYRLAASLSMDDNPLDLRLPDEGAWQLLRADDRPSRNPLHLLGAVAGHPVSLSTVSVESYSDEGVLLVRSELVKNVQLGTARFLPDDA